MWGLRFDGAVDSTITATTAYSPRSDNLHEARRDREEAK